MNPPAVRYVCTPDGMTIAYTDCGDGVPLVFMPAFFNHVQDVWSNFGSLGPFLRDLSTRFRVINYDARGQGLSTRNIGSDVTLEDFLLDFETLRRHLRLERFILLGSCSTAFLATHYAIRHPARVSALVLCNAALSWDAWRLSAIYEELPWQDWDLFLNSMVPQDFSAEDRLRIVNLWRESMTQQDYLAGVPAWRSASLEAVVPHLSTPTLVLHSKRFRLRAWQGPMELTQRLPNGRLVLMDSASLFGQRGQAVEAIMEFLADVLSNGAARQNEKMAEPLTYREVEVLQLIASGATNREIADKLFVSTRTVERHITHIYSKIGARGKSDATVYAIRHSLA